jgi:transcriptional regulator with XRE-family HTH domain
LNVAKTQNRAGRKWTLLAAKDLKKAREAAGMSRKELADTLGVSQGAIQGWESESGTPTEENQIKLCEHLGLTPKEAVETASVGPDVAKKPSRAKRHAALATAVAPTVSDSPRASSAKDTRTPDQREYAVASIVSAMVHKGLLTTTGDVYEAMTKVASAL